MDRNEISETVKKYILEELAPDCNANELKENQSLLDSGIIDSMAIMNLLDFIENKFQLKVPVEELVPENFETLTAITELISNKL